MELTDDMDEYVGEMMMGAQQCHMSEEGLLAALLKGFPPCMRADMMMLELDNLPAFLQKAKVSFSSQRVRHLQPPMGTCPKVSDLAVLLSKQNLESESPSVVHQVNNLTAAESHGNAPLAATPSYAPAGREYRKEYTSGPNSVQNESYNGRSGFRTDCAPTPPPPSYASVDHARPTTRGTRSSPRTETQQSSTPNVAQRPTGRYIGGGMPCDAYEKEQSDLDYAYDQEHGLCFYCHRAGHRWYTCGPYEEDWPEEYAHVQPLMRPTYPPVNFDALPKHHQQRPSSPRQTNNRGRNASQPPSYRSAGPNQRTARGNGPRQNGRPRQTNSGPQTASPRWNNFPAGGEQ